MTTQGKVDFQLVAKGVTETVKDVGALKAELKAAQAEMKKLGDEANNINTAIKRALGDKNASIKDLANLLRGGGPNANVQNLATKAQVDRFNAEAQQVFSKLTNTFVKGMRDFVKAVQDRAILDLRSAQQSASINDDLGALRQRQAAQAFRVANVRQSLAGQGLAKAEDVAVLQREEQALNNINTVIARITSLENQRANNLARIGKLTYDLQIAEQLDDAKKAARLRVDLQKLAVKNEQIAADRGETNELDKQIEKLRELVAAEKALTVQKEATGRVQKSTADIVAQQAELRRTQSKSEEFLQASAALSQKQALTKITGGDTGTSAALKVEQERLRLTNQLQKQTVLLNIAEESGNTVRAAALKENSTLTSVLLEQLKAANGETNEYEKQLGLLKEIVAARLAAKNASKATEASDGDAIQRGLKNRTAFANAAAEDQEFLAAQARLANASTQTRLSADGGANLFKIQAQLLANYLVMNQVFNLFQFGKTFVIELDKAFQDLQAITATTNYEMVGLKTSLVEVSEATRFTAVEVAKAATVLGQAGFSAAQIKEAIGPITLFANATGTDLNNAVDIVTSTLSVFNLTAGETGRVVNIMTDAINGTKLTTEKLGLGLQYAGQVAAETGAEFEDLVAIIGAFSQSGVRSGSTLGTGIRQLFVELQQPSAKLVDALRTVGLGLTDVDVRSQGVIGVFQNLKQAGFSAADAFTAFDVRAAQAYAAISANIDTVEKLQQSFLFSNAAMAANEVQLESLSAKMDRFASVLGVAITKGTKPLTEGLKLALDGGTKLLEVLTSVAPVTGVIGAALLGAFGGALIGRLASLAANLLNIKDIILEIRTAGSLLTAAQGLLSGSAGGAAIGAGLAVAGAAIGYAISVYNDKFPSLAKQIDTLKGKLSEVEGRYSSFREQSDAVANALGGVIDKADRLNTHSTELAAETGHLKDRFGEWGLEISKSVTNVGDLIDALDKLQDKMRKQELAELLSKSILQNQLVEAQAKQFQQSRNLDGLVSAGGGQFERQKPRLINALFGSNSGFQDLIRSTDSHGNKIDQFTSSEDLSKINDSFVGMEASLRDFLNKAARDKEGAFKDLQQRSEAQGNGKIFGNADQAVDFAKQLFAQVEKRQSLLGQIANSQAQQKQTGARIDTINFDQQGDVADLNKTLEKDRQAIASFKVQLDKIGTFVDDSTGKQVASGIDVAAKRAIRTIVDGKITQLKDTVTLLKSQGAPDDSAVLKNAQEILGQYEQLEQKATDAVVASIKETNKYTIAQLQTEIKDIKANTTKFTPIRTVFANMQEAVALFDKERAQERQLKEEELNASLKKNAISSSERDQALADFDQQTKDGGEQLKAHFQSFIDNTNQALEKVNERFQNITPIVDAFIKRFGIQLKEINEEIESRKRQSALFNDPRFEGRFSGVQTRAFERQTQLLEPINLQKQLFAYNNQLLPLRGVQLQGNNQIVQAQNELLKLNDEITKEATTPSGSREDSEARIKDLTAQRAKLEGDIQRMKDAQLGVDTKIQQLDEQRAQVAQKLNDYQDVANMKTDSFWQGLKKASEEFFRDIGGRKNWAAALTDDALTVFQAANSGFQTFVNSVVTGSETAGNAIRKFGTAVLQSMLGIATNKLAASLFGTILGGFHLLMNPTEGAGFQGYATTGVANIFQGGPVRRYAGGGPVTGRDSVPALLDPREYVIRSTAADAIGRDTLDRINAMGNRQISRSAGLAGALQPQPQKPPAPLNVWVVNPDHKPPPGPNDIIAIVTDDMARGGPTKKLVKSIMQGA